MNLTYDDETHAYQLDGRPVPSVTEIVSIITARKYSETNPAMMAQAQRRGTEVHELCEMIDYGVEPEELDVPPELVGYVNAYLTFLRDYVPEWEYAEKMVSTLEYAGRVDRIGIINGRRTIVDIKTTAQMDKLSRLALLFQLYFYKDAVTFTTELPVKSLMGVQLKKDGTYTVRDASKILEKDLPHHDVYSVMEHLLELQTIIGGYKQNV